MLLVEKTINAVLNRISNEEIALTNNWKHFIDSFDSPQRNLPNDFGGYCKMGFGSISYLPSLYADDWPPPTECDLSIYYTATTEAAKETLFTGFDYFESMDRGVIGCGLYGPKFTATVADETAYDDTLANVFATWCGGGLLNLTLDTTYARAPSPNVLHTTSGEQLCIDLASKIAAFYSHMFYISGTTLYLIDMLADAGSSTITEFDYLPSNYEGFPPVSIATAGSRARTSSYPYGQPLSLTAYHDTGANIDDALDDIITTLNSPRARLKIPFAGSVPTPGQKISWPDTALGADTDIWIRVRGITYDYDNEEIILEGEGALAAA